MLTFVLASILCVAGSGYRQADYCDPMFDAGDVQSVPDQGFAPNLITNGPSFWRVDWNDPRAQVAI